MSNEDNGGGTMLIGVLGILIAFMVAAIVILGVGK